VTIGTVSDLIFDTAYQNHGLLTMRTDGDLRIQRRGGIIAVSHGGHSDPTGPAGAGLRRAARGCADADPIFPIPGRSKV